MRWLAALGLSGALVVWRTWPFAAQLYDGTPTPEPDWLYTAWMLSTRLDGGSGDIYAPTPDALFYGPPCLGLLPFFAPFRWWLGDPVVALQLAYLAGLTATGLSVALVVMARTRDLAAGLFAVAMVFAFVDVTALPALAPQWAALCWFAPLVWAMQRGSVLLVALFATLQCLAEPVYMAPVVVAVVACGGVARLLRVETRPRGVRLMTATGITVLCLLPLMAGYARVRAANPDLATQTVWPTVLLGSPAEHVRWEIGVLAWWIAVAMPWLVIVPLLALRRPRWRDATLLAFVPLGMVLVMPLLRLVPGTEALPLRVPGRLVLGACIGLALLSGAAWAGLGRYWRLAAMMLLVAWYAHLSPVVVTRAPALEPDPVVASLLRIGRGPVLEIPARDARENARAMRRSLDYGRPLVNGYASYWPAGFVERTDDIARLPDAAALQRLVAATGLTAIVVRRNALLPVARARWTPPWPPGLTPILTTQDALVFRVSP